MDNPLVELKSVKKIYGHGQAAIEALRGINLKVYKGEFLAIMGSSGSGKSTCLNILGCLDIPSSGSYIFNGIRVERLTKKQMAILRRYYLGFVFQGYNLLERTSALENVELPLLYMGLSSNQRKKHALSALNAVGLIKWAYHTPAELSGGQQQRVAIARAIVTKPILILADEPTGNLDTNMSHEIMGLLSELNKREGISIIMVTHQEDMAGYAHRKIILKDGMIVGEE
ncbi:MAG: macrolide ABC transporter ATP-binding protein [Deltaproteobacteria bacterium]|nr:MAG: macrolide ABC transporter ATP-binding protein [Deltaproteobacteria bacterium]